MFNNRTEKIMSLLKNGNKLKLQDDQANSGDKKSEFLVLENFNDSNNLSQKSNLVNKSGKIKISYNLQILPPKIDDNQKVEIKASINFEVKSVVPSTSKILQSEEQNNVLWQSEDDDDSVRDPNYETESDSSDSKDETPRNIHEHIVGDSLDATVQEIEKHGRPRKGRKRKFENQNRSERKRKRNSNETYYNYKGKKIEPKEFVDFDCKCAIKCRDHVSVEIRKMEFERFWSLKSYDCQINFIAAGVQQTPKKRIYGRNPDKRQFSRTYKIQGKIVCREMYVKTLGINSFRVNTALKKFRGVIAINDQRGLQQGGHNKLNDVRIQEVVDQINKIPKYISHYRREQTEAKFLPPEVTIQKMYNMYRQENNNPVSMASYKKIFYERFNLKFKTLKKDTCNVCDSLKIQIENESDQDKKGDLQNRHNNHLEIANIAQKLRRQDFQLAKQDDEYECLTFDLQKTLPLPRIPTNIIFYKRQVWVYNCGVHSGKYDRGYCYVWNEGDAGRGAQEVGSCLLKHIRAHLPPNVRHLILWSDSCGGQNRNIKLTLMLKSILFSSPNLNDITMNFLCPGHSFLPNDSDFGDIESALKHQQRIYLPAEYISIMRECRTKRPFIVTTMNSNDFVGVQNIERNIVNRKTSTDGEKISWLEMRSIRLEKNEPYLLMVKQKSFAAAFQMIDIKKRTRQGQHAESGDSIFSNLTTLWPKGKQIAEKKLQNIQEVMHLIPADCQEFYTNLKGNGAIEEDVDGYNVESLDFEVEYV